MNSETRIAHDAAPGPAPRAGMAWVPGGTTMLGADNAYPEEAPRRRVRVDGFWIDRTPVTNRKFAQFVDATGHVTLAERAPTAEEYPGAPPENLVAGSMVFRVPRQRVDLSGPPVWWDYVTGADWRHPQGPDSTLEGLADHPVVHVAWDDVTAYLEWAGASLPTEAEWEFAARGGLQERDYAWGDDLMPGGEHMANVWQGMFPYHNTGDDGWAYTSPVGTYPANGYGLYDMIGNTWEWTQDWWGALSDRPAAKTCCSASRNGSACEDDPLKIPRKVLKGGSYLCAPNYCRRYRPAARHAHPVDTSTGHIGFRCVVRA